VTDELSNRDPDAPTCDYCGCVLHPAVYFCPQCSKPHRPVESMLPARLPDYADTETRLRVDARPAWTVFFMYLCVIGVGSVLAGVIWGLDDQEPAMLFLDLALLITTLVYMGRYWGDVGPYLARAGLFRPAAWIGFAVLAPLLALNFGYHQLLVELLPIEMEDYMDYFSSSWGPLIFICIMPAVVEEIGFRGIIQHQFEKVVGPWVAIGVASLAFSAAHFSVLSAPYLALVGVLLGWMKWKTGSLYPSMIAHFAHNYVVITYFE
jgi:membrane protease YdiL (CAAX protease family)